MRRIQGVSSRLSSSSSLFFGGVVQLGRTQRSERSRLIVRIDPPLPRMGVSSNGKTLRLHRSYEGSTPSTVHEEKCPRGRLVTATDCRSGIGRCNPGRGRDQISGPVVQQEDDPLARDRYGCDSRQVHFFCTRGRVARPAAATRVHVGATPTECSISGPAHLGVRPLPRSGRAGCNPQGPDRRSLSPDQLI